MGAFPVFVVDGEPSPLKGQARAARFFRGSGMDLAALPSTEAEGDASVAAPVKRRNVAFTRHVEECVELLEYLGMPVLRAKGEAEALCAQLNNEDHVDACITSDGDAFLFGAKTVIKVLRSNCKEPFECYNVADIESGLGLKRKQMVAMALLIGCDHDLHGVPGFGVETALRFVQLFDEDRILDKLYEIGKGVYPFLEGSGMPCIDDLPSSPSMKSLPVVRSPHCSHCGHPGGKKKHSKVGCNYCLVESLENCMEKLAEFVCECPSCEKARYVKEQRRHENWQIKVCKRIAAESKFPNEEIIKLYLSDNNLDKENGVLLSWNKPNVEALVDFLSFKQNWEPSYIRQQMLPMLSTIYYNWRGSDVGVILDGDEEEVATVICESTDLLDEPDIPQVLTDGKSCFLLTDEDIQLVNAAFPNEAQRFQEEQRLKEAKYHLEVDEVDHAPSASSGHKEGIHGRKRKQNQIAGVLESYLEFKKEQTKNFANELSEIKRNDAEYSIGKCVVALESIEELTDEKKVKALRLFKCELNREIFLNTKNPSVRLLWIRSEILTL